MQSPNPQFPIYIPSKGRAATRYTMRSLDMMKVPYRVVIEEQEFSDYAAVIDRARLLVLDKAYQRDYDTFDDVGDAKSKGPGPARNFIWDHANAAGAEWHWVLDDNIDRFFRFNNNLKVPVVDGTIFRCMEDFTLRFSNVVMSGPHYFKFITRKNKYTPFIANTRVYSCNLIRGNAPFRWRGRYNEDTDLSLRMLKAGFCTILFNAFLQDKKTTQSLKGGNTDEFYAREGTLEKSKMLVRMHPDVSRLAWRFGRVHHHVDYSRFRCNKLLRRSGITVPQGVDNYGMRIIPQDSVGLSRVGV